MFRHILLEIYVMGHTASTGTKPELCFLKALRVFFVKGKMWIPIIPIMSFLNHILSIGIVHNIQFSSVHTKLHFIVLL